MASTNREPQDEKKEDKRSSDRAKSLDTALAQALAACHVVE